MENVAEIVALLRKQAQLESQIWDGNGTPIASEQELGHPTAARLIALSIIEERYERHVWPRAGSPRVLAVMVGRLKL